MNISYHKLPKGILMTAIDDDNTFMYDCIVDLTTEDGGRNLE